MKLERLLEKVRAYEASLKERTIPAKDLWKSMKLWEKLFMISLFIIGICLIIKGGLMVSSSYQ